MSEMNINQVLAQIRAMSADASNKTQTVDEASNFSTLLKQSVDAVNETQQEAASMSHEFEVGESDASLAEVMVSLQKANVSFQAMTQVRNKLVDAYQDIMNMGL
ncbi:MAG: flagellar hook-basal body complex protein FliE [Methylococcaceae bacterium]